MSRTIVIRREPDPPVTDYPQRVGDVCRFEDGGSLYRVTELVYLNREDRRHGRHKLLFQRIIPTQKVCPICGDDDCGHEIDVED